MGSSPAGRAVDRTARRARSRPARRAGVAGVALLLAAALPMLAACAPLDAVWNAWGPDSDPKTNYELPEAPAGTAEAFGQQQPVWEDCGSGQLCADVHAPLDWQQPEGDTISLRLVKIPASGGDPIGTLFVNPGGPGASGADYVANNGAYGLSEDLRRSYDVIGWDPRGVGASTQIRCLDDAEMDEYLFGYDPAYADLERGDDEWIAAATEESRTFGEACAEESGELIGHVSTADTVRDLDMLRAIVGDERLHYLGFSYGTYIGARYADAYPERVGRVVLDGAMEPEARLSDVVREQTRGFELALRAYVTDCLERRDCPLDGSVDEAMASVGELLDQVEAEPLRGDDGRTVGSGVLLTAIITPLYSESNWGYLDDLIESVRDGNARIALALADSYYKRSGGTYDSNSTEAFAAINCLDYPSGELDIERMHEEAAELERIAPTIGRFQGYGDVSCAGWPVQGDVDRGPVSAEGADPILVVGTTGDPATPYRWAESLAEQLDSGVLVTFEGEGHTAYGDNSCINQVVDDYLIAGEVPASDPWCS